MRRFLWAPFGLLAALLAVPAFAAEPLSLARYFPAENLAIYAEFDGLDNHADLVHKSAAYRLLTETTAGAMLDELAMQIAARSLSGTSAITLSLKEMRTLVAHASRKGFAVGLTMAPGGPARVGFVLRSAAKGEVRSLVEKIIEANRSDETKPQVVEAPNGRKLNVGGENQGPLTWWQEGDDLAFASVTGEAVGPMTDALDGRIKNATTNPTRTALARTDKGFHPIAFAFVEPGSLPNPPPQLAAYGLDQVKRIEYRWGFEGTALVTQTRMVAPAPRGGLLAMLDQPTFERSEIRGLPGVFGGLLTFSLDPVDFYDRISAGFASDPNSRGTFEGFETITRQILGQRLREDILPLLGHRFTCYGIPRKSISPNGMLEGLFRGMTTVPQTVVAIDLKDSQAFLKVFDAAMNKADEQFKAQAAAASKPPVVRIHRLDQGTHGYTFSISPTAFTLPAGWKPTLIVGKQHLIIGTTREAAIQGLASEGKPTAPAPDSWVASSFDRLPAKMIFASLSDAHSSLLPEMIANLPGLLQWGVGMAGRGPGPFFGPRRPVPGMNVLALQIDPDLVPSVESLREFLFAAEYTLTTDADGVQFASREAFPGLNPASLAPLAAIVLLPAAQSARTAATRAQSVNNLKQIGLALHNYHSSNNRFPGASTRDKSGKPLLSWRVAILPYLEQQDLYNQFKLDEPWDSPHNKRLIAQMPESFKIPGSKAPAGKTFYRGFSGEGTMFDPKVKEGIGIAFVTDGTSNTVGVVEAKDAVEWTRPDTEIPFDAFKPGVKPQDLFAKLGGHYPGGFNALFLDGSVKFLKQTINFMTLRALITRNGGEVISSDSF